MNQTALILLCSLAVGVFGALATWHFIDVAGWLGRRLKARRERKRLEAEARALEEAEKEEGDGDEKKR